MDAPFRIRRGVPSDAGSLIVLERRCFGDPWSEASFREALHSTWSFGLVAELGEQLAGFLIAREVAGTGEVLNLATVPELRRQGIGRALLEAGIRALSVRGATEVFLEVRETNTSALRLYGDFGFLQVGVRAGYYREPMEDAFVLRLGLGSDAENRADEA
jgi:ribosomal-protein-alanine N-acetyltransferase